LARKLNRAVDLEKGQRIFSSFLENRIFAISILFASIISILVSLGIFNGHTILSQTNPFQSADIYKISLFDKGISPYSTEPWAAPYPPFYFMMWVGPYLAISQLFGAPAVFNAFRLISVLLFCACAYLIYRCQLVGSDFSKNLRNRAVSTSSLFVTCSLIAIIYPVGDAPGLLLLAGACAVIMLNKKYSGWLGVALVSLAVAFKIQPILGAALLLAYYFYLRKAGYSKVFTGSFAAFASIIAAFVVIPILFLPGALSSFVYFDAGTIQYYSFNVFSGLYDVFLNFAPNSSSGIEVAIDAIWVLVSLVLFVLVARSLFAKNGAALIEGNRGRLAIDIVSLGILVWLLVLKQTMPHYFLWAILPLIAGGRTRSLYYVLTAEAFGMVFFGISQAITTNFFTLSVSYPTAPSLVVSLLLFAGGALFDVFVILGIRELLADMKNDTRVKLALVAPQAIEINAQT
jgi:uncharacterized membrane protein YqgA involved in biofilm formation